MLTVLYKKLSQFNLIVLAAFLLLLPLWTGYQLVDPVNGGRLVITLYVSFFLLGLQLLQGVLQNKSTLQITILDLLLCVFFLYKTVHSFVIGTCSVSEKYTTISLWAFYCIFRNTEKSQFRFLIVLFRRNNHCGPLAFLFMP